LRDISHQQLALLAQHIACLHRHGTTSSARHTTSGLSILTQYWQCFNHHDGLNLARYQRLMQNLAPLTFDQDCLIHGDLNGGNLLVNQNQLAIIDWEFCTIGDRYTDLATVIVELALSKSSAQYLIRVYGESLPMETIDTQKLHMMQLYYLGLCWLWQPKSLNGSKLDAYQQRYADKLDQMLVAS